MRRILLTAGGAVALLAAAPHAGRAQQALVYCPATDATTCTNVVDALGVDGAFARVDRLRYSGTTAQIVRSNGATSNVGDLSSYNVIVVPSLASTSYDGLRNTELAAKLLAAIAPASGARGRVAGWSGAPDHNTGAGTSNKSRLIRNLAGWARGGAATGLVFLGDVSTGNHANRYNWLPAVSGVTAMPDLKNASTAECGRLYSIAAKNGNNGTITAVAGSAAGAAALNQLTATDDVLGNCGFAGGAGTAAAIGQQGSNAAQTLLVTYNVRAAATVTIGNLTQSYDNTPRAVTVTTSPANLAVSVTYAGNAAAPTNAGSYAIVATVTDPNYVGSATGTLTVAQASQAITFPAPPTSAAFGSKVTLTATASSGLPVAYRAEGACTVLGAEATITSGTGDCTLTANQGGSTNVAAAPAVTRTISATKLAQAITFAELAPRAFGDTAFTLAATGGASGLPVTYALAAASKGCALSGANNARLTITGATAADERCAVVASQAGDGNFDAAPSVTRSFAIGQAAPAFSSLAAPTIAYGTGTATVTGRLAAGTLAATGSVSATLGGTGAVAATASAQLAQDGSFTATFDVTKLAANAAGYPVALTYAATSNFAGAADQSLRLVVTPRAAALTLGNLAATYDGQPKAATVTTDPANVGTTVTYNGKPAPPTDAGSYEVVATVADGNYTGESKGTLVISKARATIALDQASLAAVYTGKPVAVTATTTPAGAGAVAVTYAGQATAPTNAGRYAVVAALQNANYEAEQAAGTLVIAKAPQAITFAQPADVTFGVAPIALGATVSSDLPVAYSASGKCAVSGSTLTVTGAGSCTVTAAQPGDANREAAEGVSRTFAIAKAKVAIALSGLSHTYDGTAKAAAAAVTPGNVAAALSYALGGQPVASPTRAGTYAVTATVADDNYEGTQAGQLVIAPKPVAATLAVQPKVYDGTTAAAAAASLGDGRVGNDVVSVQVTGAAFADKHVGAGKDVTARVALAGADAGNYALAATAAGKGDITAKPVTARVAAQSKVYDGTADAAVTGALEGAIEGDRVSLAVGSAAFADKNVGAGKTVTAAGLALAGPDAGNYTLGAAQQVAAAADITPRPIAVKAADATKVYGQDDPAFTYALTGGSLVAGDALTGALARAAGQDVGPHAIGQGTLTAGGNYALAFTAGTLTITAKPVSAASVTVASKVYDGTTAATITARALAAGSVVGSDQVALTGGTAVFGDKNVGADKPVAVTGLALDGAKAGNYALEAATFAAKASITARPLTVTATAQGKVYDGTPAATATLADDRVRGDVLTAAGTAAFADKNAGADKEVTVSGITIAGADAGNYVPAAAAVRATASITPLGIGVTAAAQDKVYDATTAAAATAAPAGVLRGDVVSAAVSGATFADANVGVDKTVTVPVTLAGADAANYAAPASVTAKASIAPRPVAVAADAQAITYGDAEPALTYKVTTGSLAEKDAFAGALARTAGRAAGTYAITQGTLSAGTNYALTFTGANLVIGKRAATVAPAAATKVYGSADPALTGTLTGFLPGDSVKATYARAAGETVGSYKITATLAPGGVLGNYDVTSGTADLAITKAPLAVAVDAKSKIQGDALPTFTGAVTGLKLDDRITATYATAATDMSAPGTYPITATLVDAAGRLANYTVTNPGGTLTVTPNAAPTVAAFAAPVDPIQLGAAASARVAFTDADVSASNPYTVTVDWGDGRAPSTRTVTAPGEVTVPYTYAAAGVYTVKVSVTDKVNATATGAMTAQHQYAVVFDPTGGFVTGGGWIDSPAGAYEADRSLTGKATFGFVSKYQKGQTVPSGNTEFQFHAAGMRFKSTSYEWLVIAGARAQYKGSGTINGGGDYGFLLTAIDGQTNGGGGADKFRLKITNKATGALVYDNQVGAVDTADPSTVLGGGNIQIQSK
jgi:hypothetical protein